jgi:hypothetical protein
MGVSGTGIWRLVQTGRVHHSGIHHEWEEDARWGGHESEVRLVLLLD